MRRVRVVIPDRTEAHFRKNQDLAMGHLGFLQSIQPSLNRLVKHKLQYIR